MQVLTVLIRELGCQRLQLAAINEAFSPGDFFGAGDLQAHSFFDCRDEITGVQQRFMRSGIKPRETSRQHFDSQKSSVQILAIDVGDLQLAARRWLQIARNLHN